MPCVMLFATAIADPRQSEQSLACQRQVFIRRRFISDYADTALFGSTQSGRMK